MNERSVVVRLRAEVAEYKRRLAEAERATESLGKQTERTSKQATTAVGRMAESVRKNREQWDTAGRTLVGFGAVTVAALGLSAKAAIDWESAWAGVLKTVDGTPDQLDRVEGGLRDLATSLPATHDEIAAVAEAAGQLGVRTADIVGFTKVMIDLGETTNLSADEAATSIAQLMNVMGTAPKDVARLGASLVALGNDGASTERDIVQMAQRISASGRLIGLTEGEVLGLANALASVGIEVEAGGSAVSRVLTDIAKAVAQGGDDLAAWAEVAGVTAADFARTWKADPAEALTQFIEGLARMHATGEDVFTTLDELGQADIRTSRALLSMATNTDLLRESLELGNTAWDDNTALLEEAEKRYDTTAAKVEIARNNINDAAITIGDSLIPIIAAASEQLAGFAEWVGAIPEPMRNTAIAVGAVAGAASLAAGGFLLLFPRVVDTVDAFRTLNVRGSRVPTVLGRIGRAAGVAAAGLTAVAAAQAYIASQSPKALGVEQTTEALLKAGDAGEQLDEMFTRLSLSGTKIGPATVGTLYDVKYIDGLDGAITRLTRTGPLDRLRDIVTFNAEGAPERQAIIDQFEAIGASMAYLVESGHADVAADQFDYLTQRWIAGGGAIEDLKELVPDYVEALAGASNQEELAVEVTDDLTESYNILTGETERLTDAQVAWREELASIDAAFVEPLAAYDALIQKNQDAAQAAADASESTEDSWEDFADQFPVTVAGYLEELQKMVDAQNAWETNMLLLSGRVSQGTLDELARMGPEGAPLVAELVNASDEELARLETLFRERAAGSTEAFASTLSSSESTQLIEAAAAQLGTEAAAEIAEKLASGKVTVEQIMAEYKLSIERVEPNLAVNTYAAEQNIRAMVERWDGTTLDFYARITASGAGSVHGNPRIGFSGGGAVYGPGTETSDSIPALLSTNEHVWSAAEVRGAGGHAAVAGLRAAAKAGGLSPVQTMRFADGGTPAWVGAMGSAPSLSLPIDGWSISGRLEVGGDGIARLVDGRIAHAQASRTAAVSRGAR